MSELSLGQIKGLTVNSNVVTVPSGHTLYAPGHVIQTVTGTYATQISTTSTSWISSGITATITPKFTTSKILIFVTSVFEPAGTEIVCSTIFRGTVSGVNFGLSNWGLSFQNTGKGVPLAMSYIDSPATTLPTTYTVGLRSNLGGTVYINDNSTTSMITLMEIAA